MWQTYQSELASVNNISNESKAAWTNLVFNFN